MVLTTTRLLVRWLKHLLFGFFSSLLWLKLGPCVKLTLRMPFFMAHSLMRSICSSLKGLLTPSILILSASYTRPSMVLSRPHMPSLPNLAPSYLIMASLLLKHTLSRSLSTAVVFKSTSSFMLVIFCLLPLIHWLLIPSFMIWAEPSLSRIWALFVFSWSWSWSWSKGSLTISTQIYQKFAHFEQHATIQGYIFPVVISLKLSKFDSPSFEDPTLYRSIVGGLQNLSFTWLGISFVVNKVYAFIHTPK